MLILGNAFSDDDTDLLFDAQREMDLILKRKNNRARGNEEEEGECWTPPYPRAAIAARATPSLQGVKRAVHDDRIILALVSR